MGPEKARRNRPCPAVKRNGEVCGSGIVSVSGYCFAHDPEAAAWREKGGRASAKKKRMAKRLRENGLGHVFDALDRAVRQLDSGEGNASDARAMARVADSMLRLMKRAEEEVEAEAETGTGWPTKWQPY